METKLLSLQREAARLERVLESVGYPMSDQLQAELQRIRAQIDRLQAPGDV